MAEDPSELTRQSLQLLQAFKSIENRELREAIVATVDLLRRSSGRSWPPFRDAMCKLMCERA